MALTSLDRHLVQLAASLVLVFAACQDPAADTSSSPTSAGGKADSFGEDDRTSVLDSEEPRATQWASSVALLTSKIDAENTASVPTLSERFDLCEGEKFESDPFLGHCTAFLVAPNMVATAAHCLEQHACDQTKVLFGYNDDERNNDIQALDPEHTYACLREFRADDIDVALIELDRPVLDRAPLRVSTANEGDAVALVGHPLGGSATVDLSGTIVQSLLEKFQTTLDTFSGHSGAPIFDLVSGSVVGVHVRGAGFSVVQRDSESCNELNTCVPGEFDDCLASAIDTLELPFAQAGLTCDAQGDCA